MADEDVFGPTVDAFCHHGFDFTLLFEEIVLALIPITLSWLATSIRVWTLWHAVEKVNRSWLYAAKQVRRIDPTSQANKSHRLRSYCI